MIRTTWRLPTIITTAAGAVLVIVFGLILLLVTRSITDSADQALDEATIPLVTTASDLAFNPIYLLDIDSLDSILQNFASSPNILFIGIRDKNGITLAETGTNWEPFPDFSLGQARRAISTQEIVHQAVSDKYYVSGPVSVENVHVGTVQFVFDLQRLRAGQLRAQTIATLTIVIGMAVLLGAIFVLVSYTSRPLSRLASAAESIGQGDLSTEVKIRGAQEIDLLAKTFEQMRSQLQASYSNLEQQVADRTKAIQASAEVSRRLSTILDQQHLVQSVVDEIQRAFDYYHVHVYFYDNAREMLIMAGGTGEPGRVMLERHHAIARGRGLVGQAAENNLEILVPDTQSDPNWLPNPLLPDTRSEMAVPITIGNDLVVGVLDVQQNTVDGLSQRDLDLIRSIANQIAVTIQNVRAFTAAQKQAEREAIINTISQRIQLAGTPEAMMQIATSELARALGTQRAFVQIDRLQLGQSGKSSDGGEA